MTKFEPQVSSAMRCLAGDQSIHFTRAVCIFSDNAAPQCLTNFATYGTNTNDESIRIKLYTTNLKLITKVPTSAGMFDEFRDKRRHVNTRLLDNNNSWDASISRLFANLPG